MIRYALTCDGDHAFEGWFRDSAAFDRQKDAGEVACPVCGSVAVEKQLMAPAVATRRAEATVPLAAAHPAMTDPKLAELVEAIRRLKRHIAENSEYVGDRFPEEARRMHYEEAEARAIHGEASLEEARALLEEGIPVLPLPTLPEERN
ncbi:hypothetical protein EDC22_11260 [Tepidamorphus gemmatus]|uniref:DUF1178 family protein n=1 Tax=Tepidamorphus gemmatus TaxID=747076 RepID=A0A4R3LYV3_9HYPH|nr:DUF1178 family protein [Tepidamorphus gemmatus]TCT05890.1 hypothetical protein EDC22_11260 [Tepidamorphus gemmatus]